MKTKSYYLVNIIVLIIAMLFIYHIMFQSVLLSVLGKKAIGLIITSAIMAFVVYAIKAVRLYLIMLEQRIPLKRFLKQYLKTTVVNILLPFKSGEIFKIYCYGTELNNYKISLLCALVERYFDSIPLLILLVLLTLKSKSNITLLLGLLVIFFLLLTITFAIFPSSYRYLNKFCITNIHSENGIKALKFLSKTNKWYCYIRNLMRGRALILLLLSTITWLMEYGILICLSVGLEHKFSTDTFIIYMNSVFAGSDNLYVKLYVAVSAIVFGLLFVIIYGLSFLKRRQSDASNLHLR